MKVLAVGRPSPLPPDAAFALMEGRLHVGERIGSDVHVAWLERNGLFKRVAVKAMQPSDGARRAIRSAALVRHPNVVEVLDYLEIDAERAALVMEMVDGMNLASFLRTHAAARRRVPLDLALFLAIEIAEGLAGARLAKSPTGAVRLAHLDLTARSVLLSYHGEVKLEGFGLASPLDDGSGVRRVRSWPERLATMAPEMVRGEQGDGRSDVFSLGVLMHELLVGPRFPANVTDDEACEMAKSGFVCPNLIAPPLPEGIGSILNRALSTDARDRPAHAGVVAYDLRTIALRMGVGDARAFLRSALFEMSESALP